MATDAAGANGGGDVLDRFRPQVAAWFREVFSAPTPVQRGAWSAIADGSNALVVAPTGSGKTLAAFLWALNNLTVRAGQAALPMELDDAAGAGGASDGVRVLYISPLKALGVDVERNLRVPLTGIARVAQRMGVEEPDITIGVRSGDTPQSERNRQVRRPPDVLITTPESAYLMLTSKAAGILETVDTVIIDEIHALAGTKRGVHLALTLERLEALTGGFQRVGLSATVRPLEAVANFLGGGRPVEIIAPPAEKQWALDVHVPVDDMSDLPTPEVGSTIGELTVDDPLGIASPVNDAAPIAEDSALPAAKSIWPFIEEELYREVMAHRSTLVFVNSRRTAERVTSRLNELYAHEHDPEALSAASRRDPAQLMKQTDTVGQAPALIARAHHGSVSKDERALTEDMLKAGELRAVVATSSLELGIDMGAVDLVVQVESPPSVASGLQRVGRAGHTVGAVSQGSFYPKHRADLVQSALTVSRMRAGLIERLHTPENPLDVLAQQTVAAVAAAAHRSSGAHPGSITADEWYEQVRRAWPYRNLSRDVFDSVIDLVSGTYPSTDFAELRPRVVYDRMSGELTARPGAQRVAVTSGGTIPDRGMFGVFLAGTEVSGVGGSKAPRRVGELDEEMVYESRVGDVFTLGASSWRIEDITRDQVIVTPAPGHTGRLPFWNGDQAGRPFELGKALGAFRRDLLAADAAVGAEHGGVDKLLPDLDERARANTLAYLREQQEATGVVPDETTLVLERFRDELGDWRVILHTPFGRGVNAAWALAVGKRVAEETGMDPQAVAGDDGIVLRLPEADTEPSGALFVFDPDDIAAEVTDQVGSSALFASRFRECAARALLLPRRNPGKRAPLWQQRQRAEQLLDVARKYPTFPIILETVRECLQDVYDLPALTEVMEDLQHRRVRVVEVTTDQPSPFASTLLFNYTGAFMYEGDTPLAEKRAAALALDPALLAKLLGTVELRELLDADIIDEVHAQLQRISDGRRARNAEELADLLRVLGPVPVADLDLHTDVPGLDPRPLLDAGRAMRVRIAGREHLAQTLDAPLLRDGLGIPVPPGVAAQVATVNDAVEQLLSRWARTRGPFVLRDAAEAFGLSVSVTHSVLSGLIERGEVIEGRFRQGVDEQEYCAADVLKIIRSRSLAAARAATQPVSQTAFARFIPDWQQVAGLRQRPQLRGADGVFAVLEQLAGVRLPVSAWESLVLPARVAGYDPLMLDELTSGGEVLIKGAGTAGAADPWVMLLPTDYAEQLAPVGEDPFADRSTLQLSPLQESILEVLGRGGGFLFNDLMHEVRGAGDELGLTVGQSSPEQLRDALWDLVDAGLVAPDSFAPLRARLSMGTGGRGGAGRGGAAHKAKRRPTRSRLRMGRTSFAQTQRAQQTPPDMTGRWALAVRGDGGNATARSVAHGEAWLDRYGVVTRGSVQAEDVIGGFAMAYKVLSGFEESGKALRGYVVEGLGAAQFSTPALIDRLRGMDDSVDAGGWPSGSTEPAVYLLAAADPANAYGAALPWPERDGANTGRNTGGLSRGAGAVVVLVDGVLVAHLTRGGRTLTTFADAAPSGIERTESAGYIVDALREAVASRRMAPFVIEKVNGEAIFESPWADLLRGAGAGITPRGVRISGQAPAPRRPAGRGSTSYASPGGRSVAEALEDLSFDDEPFEPPRNPGGGFRPRR
ncbi:ATP-dependent helicase [Corynebacterium incognita]|uniref:ATP-dependent helicase n=1 Tax=Corynebacterium incognita TaxID=2754725 RepID=A0A7G7CNL3_9CORY|nr:ATP-dependent helicase [Corynebacterium incognita]QNE89179.1 ATP-dependent helicase [Corynebacterium incognita]